MSDFDPGKLFADYCREIGAESQTTQYGFVYHTDEGEYDVDSDGVEFTEYDWSEEEDDE